MCHFEGKSQRNQQQYPRFWAETLSFNSMCKEVHAKIRVLKSVTGALQTSKLRALKIEGDTDYISNSLNNGPQNLYEQPT